MKRTVAIALAALSLCGCTTATAATPANGTCAAASAYSAPRYGVTVLVLRDGKVLCQDFENGATAGEAFPIFSGTKSFNGIIAAAAVQDGLLTLDEPVSRTISEWRSDPAKAAVTIRQLLQLTSGLGSKAFPAPDFAEAIAMPLNAAPGARFQYGAAPFQVFGELMRRKLVAAGRPGDPTLYLKARILDPIGVHWSDWRRTPAGDPMMDQGAVFTADQWALFGEFVRHQGVLNGHALVDPLTFAELFRGTSANPAYGVTWWLPKATPAEDVVTARVDLGRYEAQLPADMVAAAGAGDQRLFVIPSCRLTVVRQARLDAVRLRAARRGADEERQWSDFAFIKPILDAYCTKPNGAAG